MANRDQPVVNDEGPVGNVDSQRVNLGKRTDRRLYV